MKCIIVDDEPLARTGIKLLLQDYPDFEIAGSFNQPATALAYLMQNAVDLIFLDIRMPGINGIEFARAIAKSTMIIFVTAHAEYALDSYEVDAIDYLVKPINSERFHQAIKKALDYQTFFKQVTSDTSLEFSNDYILVRAERQFIKILLKEILFIEGLKDYVILFLKDQKIITNMNLKMVHAKLPEKQFVRVSKSYIVNIHHVHVFDNNSIRVAERDIPIGNVYRELLMDRLLGRM